MNDDQWEASEKRRRRAGVITVLVVIAALVLLAWVLYPRLGSLLQPAGGSELTQSATTEDVRVQRGPITKVLQLAGQVEPSRKAKLAFRAAQGKVVALYVLPGQDVEEGQVLVELDAAALQRALATARGELLDARLELDALLEDRGLTKRIGLEEDLRDARAALETAQRELASHQKGKGTPQEERTRAAADLAKAREDLDLLRESKERKETLEGLRVAADLAEIEHGPYAWIANPSEEDRDRTWILGIDMLNKRGEYDQAVLQYAMDIRAADQDVAKAERALQALDREIAAGSPAIELMKREAAVKQAQAKVDSLQAQLQALDEGLPDVDVAKAQATVTKLEGKTADAEAAVAEAKIVAPFAGVVDDLRIQPGDIAAPNSQLMILYSISSYHLLAQVNEMDVTQLKEGQSVTVTFDAFPGQQATGQLGEIPRYGTYQNGLTVFQVQVAFDPGDLALRMGMSANVSVPLFRKDDVVLVPTMAVQRDADGLFVIVVEGRQTQQRRVQLGISDGINTEVISGLQPGEVVRIVMQVPIGPVYY